MQFIQKDEHQNWVGNIQRNKKEDVASIIIPIMKDFVAAAPTYPIVISKNETGADKCS